MKDGGPAFPTTGVPKNFEEIAYEGMALRDYFAAKAMQGLVSKYSLNKPEDQDIVTKLAYQLADTMLKARKS